MRGLILILFASVIASSNIHANIKNLYIIVEPNSIHSSDEDNKKVLLPIFKNLLQIGKWVSNDKITPKFKKVFIRVAGGNTYTYNEKTIHKLSKKKTFVRIYKNTKDIQEYSIADTLAYFPQDLEKLKGWKGEETLLLIMGDINFVKNGITSHGKYLNSFWLENKNSPFVKYLLSKDNTPAKDTSVIIMTRTQLGLREERIRQDFIVNLLSNEKVGMNVYYIGESYNIFSAPSSIKSKDPFILKLIKDIKNRQRDAIKVKELRKTNICQIVGTEDSITVKDCGGR